MSSGSLKLKIHTIDGENCRGVIMLKNASLWSRPAVGETSDFSFLCGEHLSHSVDMLTPRSCVIQKGRIGSIPRMEDS
jgi:hypothetical protein